MASIIDIKNLNKSFSPSIPHRQKQKTHALCEITLQVEAGTCLGILGPNGAGKTTLLKVLSTLILPDGGEVTINGTKLGENDQEIKEHIGLVTHEDRSFYWRLSGRQNLEFFGQLYGLSLEQVRSKIEKYCQLLSVDYADRRFDSYSSGMKMKFALMRPLLHDPDIYYLDEPLLSLDSNSTEQMKQVIRSLINSQRTVLWATNSIQEAEELCTHFAILRKGSLVGHGTLDQLRKRLQKPSATIKQIYDELVYEH